MVVIGITGTIGSGKETAVKFLVLTLGFIEINLEGDHWEETIQRSNFESEEDYRIAISLSALKQIMTDITKHYIVYPITLLSEISTFRKRLYFILIGIDAPPSIRYKNYVNKHGRPKNQLQGFIYIDDHVINKQTKYGLIGYPCQILQALLSSERIIHNKSSIEDFYAQLNTLDLLNPEHSRPEWETYFIRLAEIAATRSACLQFKQGVVIVNQKKVVATGYNGTPANMLNCSEHGCDFCAGHEEAECLCIHAEINALIEAGRSRTIGSELYTTHFPCLNCAKSILQSEVTKVIFSRNESFNQRVSEFLRNSGILVIFRQAAIATQL